jgi:hypothetical protein
VAADSQQLRDDRHRPQRRVLSVWEGCETRQHNRLSVLPNLDAGVKQLSLEKGEVVDLGGTEETMAERTHYLEIRVENSGLGPAVFEKAQLFRAGADTVLYETQEEGDVLNIYRAEPLVRRIRATFPDAARFTGALEQGIMMKAGGAQPFLQMGIRASTVPDTLSVSPQRRLLKMIGQYSFVVCYCSVYGEDCDQEHIGADPPPAACRL